MTFATPQRRHLNSTTDEPDSPLNLGRQSLKYSDDGQPRRRVSRHALPIPAAHVWPQAAPATSAVAALLVGLARLCGRLRRLVRVAIVRRHLLGPALGPALRRALGPRQRTTSISRTRGFSKAASEFSANHSESEQRVDLLSVTDVTNMPERTHFLILQKFNTRPLRLKTPLWFRDPELRAQVYSLRDNSGPNPAGPLPANSIAARQQEIERLARIQAGKEQTDEVEKVFALTATLTAG